jgi:2-haloacid dehalogenase
VCELEQKGFFAAFNSIIASYNPGIVEIIRNIKDSNRVKLLCLSNINSSHWEYLISKKWGFLECFDELILSHEVHMTKPDKRIFQYAIKRAECKAEEIVFIDDGMNNIRAARELGIIGINFSNKKDLAIELKKLQIMED